MAPLLPANMIVMPLPLWTQVLILLSVVAALLVVLRPKRRDR